MSLNILVITDNSSFGSFLCELLTDKGYAATGSPHGESAFRLIRSAKPDLLIVEFLPEFLGSEYGQKMRAAVTADQLPVVAITESSFLEEELLLAFDVIRKPVDHRRLLDDVAALADPARRRITIPPLDDPSYRLLRSHLLSRTGLHFDQRNRSSLERGVGRRMSALRIASYRDYLDFLKRHGEDRRELQKLLRYLTIGETHFFRYRAQFDALRTHLSEHRAGRLRIWSAGCSTGEEAYSIAMTVLETLPNCRARDVVIHATDINNHSLQRAREGVYSSWSLRNLNPEYLGRYFEKVGDSYLVSPEVKRLVRFSHLNLSELDYAAASGGELRDLDAIFCRNVMIYFTREQGQLMVDAFARSLKEGGSLFLGHAETLLNNCPDFDSRGGNGCFYYRKRTESAAPPRAKAAPTVTRPTHPLPVPLLEQARGRFEAEEFDAALTLLDRHLSAFPAEPEALVLKGFILAGRGNLAEALTLCERAISGNDLFAAGYFLRGVIRDAEGKIEQAADEYRKALLLDHGFIMPRYYRSRLFLRMGKREDAAREIRNGIKMLARYGERDTIPYSGGMTRAVCKVEMQRTLAQLA